MKRIVILVTFFSFTAASAFAGPGGHGHGKGKFMGFFDSNEDGEVTLTEFNDSAKARFERIDGDNDGNISKDEFRAYIKERRTDRKKKKFARMDTDNDGQVTKDEYVAYKTKKAERKFSRMDKNSDGTVNVEEHANCKKNKHKRHGGRIFHHMDSNDDGSVTQAESYEAWLKWFKRIDVNADDVVSSDEVQAYRQQRRKHKH